MGGRNLCLGFPSLDIRYRIEIKGNNAFIFLIFHRIIVGAPSNKISGSIFWCPYTSDQCNDVNFDIYKSAAFSYTKLGNELFGYSISTLPMQQDKMAIVRVFLQNL